MKVIKSTSTDYNTLLLFPVTKCLLKIYITLGVSSATGERSFSALRRIKTHLQSTERIGALAILSIEMEMSNKLDLEIFLQKFSCVHKNRRITLF